jgi:predicted house-cleaning noncanonical NTP pyrophosphatase (MazG superfamily)
LIEEAREVEAASGNLKELVKEIGDVQEVIDAVIDCFGLDDDEIKKLKEKRKSERGGFEKKIFLEYTE